MSVPEYSDSPLKHSASRASPENRECGLVHVPGVIPLQAVQKADPDGHTRQGLSGEPDLTVL